jgi:hypothetical protein
MIRLDRKKLRQELANWQVKLAKYDGWPEYEAIGRLLHWLGEPGAPAYFRHAAAAYLAGDSSGHALLTAGNWYRLAADMHPAQALWDQAYAKLVPGADRGSEIDLQRLIACCFFLGKYPELEARAQHLAIQRPSSNVRAFTIARLARAQQDQSPPEALAIAQHFADRIRVNRTKIANTGSISLWDWYEIALRLAKALGAVVPEEALP